MLHNDTKSRVINNSATDNSAIAAYKKNLIDKSSLEIQKIEKQIVELEQVNTKKIKD